MGRIEPGLFESQVQDASHWTNTADVLDRPAMASDGVFGWLSRWKRLRLPGSDAHVKIYDILHAKHVSNTCRRNKRAGT